MTEKVEDPAAVEYVELKIPKVLYERIAVCCHGKDMTPYEFLIDALNAKVALAYKEKRKKPRL